MDRRHRGGIGESMATTTNFGWETPDDTDLVKDGAAAIRTLGNSIDTSMVDLKGGTTGQVLSKNSNTDMDFTWVAQDDSNAIQNAIVDAKGDLIAASAADTPTRLAVGTNEHRLVADSAETTGLKYVADTTNYAIAAKGDLLVGTAADTLAALTVGTNGHVLTADSTVSPTGVKWAAPAGGGKVLQVVQATYSTETSINSATLTDTGLQATITPSSASSKVLVMAHNPTRVGGSARGAGIVIDRGGTNVLSINSDVDWVYGGSSTIHTTPACVYLDSPATTSATTYKMRARTSGGACDFQNDGSTAVMILMEIGA